MTLDTSSFPAYLRSLNLSTPVTTKPRRYIAGPPTPVVDLALRLGLGSWLFNGPRTQELLTGLGLDGGTFAAVAQRLRTRGMWLAVWEELAQSFIAQAEQAIAQEDFQGALDAIQAAFIRLFIGINGDGFYFYPSMEARWRLYPGWRRLHRLYQQASQSRVERIFISHPCGRTWGWLHFPPGLPKNGEPVPALVGLHPLGVNKEIFDYSLSRFRAAGYATLCVDLPAHGENFRGPRLQADSEWVGVAALESARQHPDLDPNRLGVIGGSLGAYFALRTAAASPLARVCVAYATPFDLGTLGPTMLPGIIETFAGCVGAHTRAELLTRVKQFHLRDAAGRIECPVCLVHGTQDSVCDFTGTYTLVSHLKAPVTVIPLVGVDHESALPQLPDLARPALDWLSQNFGGLPADQPGSYTL
jgi:alpha-beta hydrolase superfamily lysophospholipase